MKNLINKAYFIPLVIFIVNVAFKCINLDAYPIWYDECFGVFCFQQTLKTTISVSDWDINPPFFPVMLWAWMKVFGVSEFGVRLFSVFFSSAAAVLLYLFCKRFFNQKTALIASMLFLASDVAYFYAHEARAYMLILFLSLASMWMLFEMIRNPKWWHALILGALYYCIFMTHFLVGLTFAMQGIIILSTLNRKIILYYIGACMTFLLLFVHFIPRFVEIFTTGERPVWLASPSPQELWKLIYHFNNGPVAFYILFGLVILSYLKMVERNEKVSAEQIRILLYVFLLGFGIVLINFFISSVIPMFLERYLLFTLIGFIILLSFFIGKLPVNDYIVYSALGVACLYFMWNIDTTTPKLMNYRSVAEFVKKERNDKTDIIVQDSKFLFTYYFDRETFKDYDHFDERLAKQYVTVARDSNDYKKVFTAPEHNKLILVQTWVGAFDPDSTLVKRILKDYHVANRPGPFEGADVWVFEKN